MNTDLLLLFQQKLDEDKGDLQSRQVILAFDGMAIRDGISYCRNSGKVSGLEDVGDLVTYTTETLGASLSDLRLAKECMQLMATTLNGKYRVPIGYYLIQKATAGLVATMIDDAIQKLHLCKIDVHNYYYYLHCIIKWAPLAAPCRKTAT